MARANPEREPEQRGGIDDRPVMSTSASNDLAYGRRVTARGWRGAVVALALCTGGVFIGAGPAHAHSSPISSNPKPNSTIRALPEELSMTFDGPIVESGGGNRTMMVVADPMHNFISTPFPIIEDNVISTVLSPTMVMSGRYAVSFRAFGSDGHYSQGTWYFTVDPTASPDATVSQPAVPIPRAGEVTLAVDASGSGVTDAVGSASGRATADFRIDFATSTMCYTIRTTDLPNVTAGHVHASSTDVAVADQIYLPIDVAAINARTPLCAKQDPQSLARLAAQPTTFVLMIHTTEFPDGAAAGAFRVTSPAIGAAQASSARVVPPAMWLLAVASPLLLALVVIAGAARVRRRSAFAHEQADPQHLSVPTSVV